MTLSVSVQVLVTSASLRQQRGGGGRDQRVVDDHVGELALCQADELVGERVALVVGAGAARTRDARARALVATSRAMSSGLNQLKQVFILFC